MMKTRPPYFLQETATGPEIVQALNQLTQWALEMYPDPGLFIEDITESLPRHADKIYADRPLNQIHQIVIHHVGVDAPVTAKQTAAYHVRKGWPGIGYHFFVTGDGRVQQTNPLTNVSFHCAGACNWVSVGICLEGSFMDGRWPPSSQLAACRSLNNLLCQRLGLPPKSAVVGHRAVRQTACPGNAWYAWKGEVVP